MLPRPSLLAGTTSDADAPPATALNCELPSDRFPIVKATVPAGAAAPEAERTKAVSVVEAFCATTGGVAATVVAVATVAPVTVIEADADEGPHTPSPE